MKSLKERRNSGVSEVIGTLLTLSITVTLFTTVFLYMGHFPTPTGTTYANFDVTAKKTNNNTVTWINITHTGGESLKDYQAAIYIIGSSNPATASNYMFYIHNATNAPADGIWNTGQTLDYRINDNGKIDLSTGYLLVFDRVRNTVVWRGDLTTGLKQPLPPIIMDRGTTPSPAPTKSDFQIYAYIKDPNNDFNPPTSGSATVYLPYLHLYSGGVEVSSVTLHHDIGYRYVSPKLNASSSTPQGSHIVEIKAVDAANHTTTDTMSLVISAPSTEKCDIYVSSVSIVPQNPTTGEETTIYVTFTNDGDSYGYSLPTITDVLPNGTAESIPSSGLVYVAAHGESMRTYYWDHPAPAGEHHIIINATIPPGAPEDSVPSNNAKEENVTILPKILLVDDDHNEEYDTAAYMRDALNATGYDYTEYRVRYVTDSGPQLATLEKYDVVIWMTGMESHDTLTTSGTENDITNLEDFLDGGHKLWLIGENIMDDASGSTAFTTFMRNYMGVQGVDTWNVPVQHMLVNGSSPALGDISNVTLDSTGYDNGKYMDYLIPAADANESMYYNESGTHKIMGVSHDTPNYATMFFSFEFSTIKYGSDRAGITYEVLKWLSGLPGKTGEDVAVAQASVNPEYPFYMQSVKFTAVVRNNGWVDETTRVQMFLDDVNIPCTPSIVTLAKNGGSSVPITANWTAKVLGVHTLTVRVDPYDEIQETDEQNNVMEVSFMVRFNTLIVDDDESSNNGGTLENTTEYVTDSMDHLLSDRNPDSTYPYTVWVVPKGDNGPDYTELSKYNTVIWVTGNANTDTFTAADRENLTEFLNPPDATFSPGSLWIVGTGFLDDLASDNTGTVTGPSFLSEIGIDAAASSENPWSSGLDRVSGILNDPITHGIDFKLNASMNTGADMIVPVSGAESILENGGDPCAIRYSPSGGYKTVVFDFDIGSTSGLWDGYIDPHFPIPADIGNRTRYELTYLVMHWFGQINSNKELEVANDFLLNGMPIGNAHIVIGNSYILEARVHNIGDTNVIYATVRFYDGDSIIGATGVGVAAGNVSTVSTIWTPKYAGASRPIRVIVDYYEELQEIPDPSNLSQNLFEFNNEAVHYVPVYFFWDDMENGTANWMHEATIMNINGESPIDYLGSYYTTTYTNVISTWDDSMSVGVNKTDTTYHSSPYSYWLKEEAPSGTTTTTTTQTIPLDVVFVMDSSGSMTWDDNGNYVGANSPSSRWYQARVAAINFIQNLTDNDRASIWTFDGNGHPYHLDSFSYMTDANKSKFINDLDNNVNVNGGTPIYDTIGDAINDDLTVCDPDASDNDRLDFIVVLTDGADTKSTTYSANRDWGNDGLLHAPPMIYTIGVVDTQDLHVSGDTYPTAGDDPNWQPYYDLSTGSTDEYNLWHIANSSLSPPGKYGRDFNQSDYGYHAISDFYPNLFSIPNPQIGHYYFAQHASQIGDIFAQIRSIAKSISSGGGAAGAGNVTRSADFTMDNSRGGGTRSSLSGPTTNAVETRYMRSDTQTVNGLNAYTLGTTQSSNYATSSRVYSSTVYAGIRVWIRDSGGTETEVTSGTPVAIASQSSGTSGLVSATWNCPGASISKTDSVVVRVYLDSSPPTSSSTAVATFTTEALGSTNLGSSTWTVYYYLYTSWSWSGNYGELVWGTSTYNSRIEGFEHFTPGPPGVSEAYPPDGKTALPSQYVDIVFNRSMDTSKTPTLSQNSGTTVSYTFEGWFTTYQTDDTAIWSHDNWTDGDTVSLTVSDYVESSGAYTGDPYTWSFSVIAFTSTGGGSLPPSSNTNKTAVTPSVDLRNTSSAILTFWNKYNIVPGANGGFLELGYNDSGTWKWKYVMPSVGSYTGNLKLGVEREDSFGNSILYCWNGVSAKGTFGWEFVKVNLLRDLRGLSQGQLSQVKIKFNYTEYGGGTGYGWYIDDVKVVISREGNSASNINGNMSDVWQLALTQDRNGHSTHAWWNGDPSTGYFRGGIDDSLITRPIDLTNAWNAQLSAYFRFNINNQSGAPPDGFRVEVSTDNGVKWTAINLGARTAWGVSGTNNSANRTSTGTDAGNYWVEAGSLMRLNVDLSAFSGNVILLRFRVITTSASTYDHYEDSTAGFGGFYIDDVVISGESLGT